jgi:hypothetical protein
VIRFIRVNDRVQDTQAEVNTLVRGRDIVIIIIIIIIWYDNNNNNNNNNNN